MPGVDANDMLDELVMKALALKPENRYATASEMLQDWWQVVAALDRDAPLLVEGHDVVFDDELSSNTLVDGPSSGSFRAAGPDSASSPGPSTTLDERLTVTRTCRRKSGIDDALRYRARRSRQPRLARTGYGSCRDR